MERRFKVGDCMVDPQSSTVCKEGTPNSAVRIEPKMMDLLVYLAQNAGEVVRKEDILSDIWSENFVNEEVLSNVVWKLRNVLQDDPRKPRFIETIHKKGYRLLAPVSSEKQMGLNTSPHALTVGHQTELAALQSCYASMLSGRALLVGISGEAGIGKTTLVEGFLRNDSNDGCYITRGKCSEHLAGTGAYLPILEALDNLTRSGADANLTRLLRQTAPSWYAQVFPRAKNSAAAAGRTAASSLERMKRELTEFLRKAAEHRPVIIFFDDLHWADASSADIMGYVFEHCYATKILILVAYRPEQFFTKEHLLINRLMEYRAHGRYREIALSFLSANDVGVYIDQCFPGHRFPPEFADAIYRRTEGNPLFMVDLIAHLRQRGVIAQDSSQAWALRQSISEIQFDAPESVRGLIDLKIRHAGELHERLLSCAAVQGFDFDSGVLALTLNSDLSTIEEDLQKLDRVYGLIKRLGSFRSRSGLNSEQYQFAHILYRDALYENLSPASRTALSGAMAKALQEIHGGDSVNLISHVAFLFEAAGNFLQAAKHFLTAAQRALEISAYPEAMALARKGAALLSSIQEGPDKAELASSLQFVATVSLSQMKGYAHPEVKEAYNRAFEMCIQSKNSLQASRYLLSIGSSFEAAADLKQAVEVVQKYSEMPSSCRNEIFETWFHLIYCVAISHMGDPFRALENARRCVAIGELLDRQQVLSFGDLDVGLLGRMQLARILWLCGYPAQARLSAEKGYEECKKTTHPATVSFALFFGSWFYQYLNDYARSLELADEAVQISLSYGFRMQEGWGRVFRGWAKIRMGAIEEGLGELEKGIEIRNEIGWKLGHTEILGFKAQALSKLGDIGEAIKTIDSSFEFMRSTSETYYEAELCRIKAQILSLKSGHDAAEIEALLRQGIRVARKQQAKSLELRSAISLAQLLTEQGRIEEGRKELKPVYDWFTEGSDTPDLQQACRLLAIQA